MTGDGAPQAGIAVRIYVAGTATLAGKTVTAADGTYTLVRWPPGPATRSGSATRRTTSPSNGRCGATKQSHATTFTLDAGTPTTINATLVDAPV